MRKRKNIFEDPFWKRKITGYSVTENAYTRRGDRIPRSERKRRYASMK